MSRIYLTSDLDWASEDVIAEALRILVSLEVPITFFQTHRSEEVLSFARDHVCELEWHPSFLPGSSHGSNVDEIIGNLSNVPSEKDVVRCHLYHCPDDRYPEFLSKTGIRRSSNDLVLLEHRPIYEKDGITEIPLFFEDGCFIKAGYPFDVNFVLNRMQEDGDYVFLFHPIHVAFNSFDYSLTRKLKDGLSREDYHRISRQLIEEKRYQGYGVSSLLVEIVDRLKRRGDCFRLVKEAKK